MPLKDYVQVTAQLMDALRQLENTDSTVEKRRMIGQYTSDIPEFKDVLVLALDPYKRFGIAKFPTGGGSLKGTNTWADIKFFLDTAAVGDDTLTNITRYAFQIADNMNSPTRELFRRVLLKDLRCGVGATLVNSVLPNLIPQFSCMLASPLEEHHIKKLQAFPGKVFGQPKMNGDRSVSITPGGPTDPVQMFSRKGFPQHNYQFVSKVLASVHEASRKSGLVFDGEIIVGDFWKTRGTKKLAGNEAAGAVYHIFDTVEYSQWEKGETDIFSVRARMLREFSKLPVWEEFGCLARVPTMALSDLTWDGLSTLRDKLIDAGHEGLIIRPDLPYDFSPSARSNMYKHKKMDTLDCVIREVLPGEEGKKMAEVAAKLRVELPNGQICDAGMGKGLNMEALAKLWRLRGRYVGLVAEISYQEKTVNQSGEWKLQFPKFTGVVRKDKS